VNLGGYIDFSEGLVSLFFLSSSGKIPA